MPEPEGPEAPDAPEPVRQSSPTGRRVLVAFGGACVAIQIGFGELHAKPLAVGVVAAVVAVALWCSRLLA